MPSRLHMKMDLTGRIVSASSHTKRVAVSVHLSGCYGADKQVNAAGLCRICLA